jgi:hypothetical protein
MNQNHLRKLMIAGASGHACVAAEAAEGETVDARG